MTKQILISFGRINELEYMGIFFNKEVLAHGNTKMLYKTTIVFKRDILDKEEIDGYTKQNIYI